MMSLATSPSLQGFTEICLLKRFSAHKETRMNHLIHKNQKHHIFDAINYSYRPFFQQTEWSLMEDYLNLSFRKVMSFIFADTQMH